MRNSNLKLNRDIAPVIKGGFSNGESRRQMAIKRVNGTLTLLLLIVLFITGLSYYFATTHEMILNNLNRDIIITNDDNFDLQYRLDKMKSFTNVGSKVEESQLLKKAEEIIEVPYVEVNVPTKMQKKVSPDFHYSLGY
jgi:predicted PurR-regulated permease PerM